MDIGDQVYLINYLKEEDNWIGLSNKGHNDYYSWVDTWPFKYANWNDTQPPSNAESDLCVRFSTVTGKWITDDCSKQYNFACKHHQSKHFVRDKCIS